MTKLTLEDLEAAMRRHYGIAQEEEEEEELQGDLEQVGVLEEVGIGLERWARLRGLPVDYALALREYLDQEEGRKRRTEEDRRAVGRGATGCEQGRRKDAGEARYAALRERGGPAVESAQEGTQRRWWEFWG